ncbi:uncharacterized protein [Lepeophtheirus salmonis]|uniref:uncharacterized protein isoform X2 n=1 Tax=Lepeophtheirus salmonis TaxID=72036 RepID=UPI003AF347EC
MVINNCPDGEEEGPPSWNTTTTTTMYEEGTQLQSTAAAAAVALGGSVEAYFRTHHNYTSPSSLLSASSLGGGLENTTSDCKYNTPSTNSLRAFGGSQNNQISESSSRVVNNSNEERRCSSTESLFYSPIWTTKCTPTSSNLSTPGGLCQSVYSTSSTSSIDLKSNPPECLLGATNNFGTLSPDTFSPHDVLTSPSSGGGNTSPYSSSSTFRRIPQEGNQFSNPSIGPFITPLNTNNQIEYSNYPYESSSSPGESCIPIESFDGFCASFLSSPQSNSTIIINNDNNTHMTNTSTLDGLLFIKSPLHTSVVNNSHSNGNLLSPTTSNNSPGRTRVTKSKVTTDPCTVFILTHTYTGTH